MPTIQTNQHVLDERKVQPSEQAPHGIVGICGPCSRYLERNPMLAGDGSKEAVSRLLGVRLMMPPDQWQHQTFPGDLLHKAMLNAVGERHAYADMRGAALLKYGDEGKEQEARDWDKFLLDARGMGLDFDQAREMWRRLQGR